MYCISGNYHPLVGPLMPVAIFPAQKIQDHSGKKQDFIKLPPSKYNALIDTGATITCISDKLVNDLKLKRINITTMSSATEDKEVDVFFIYIGLLGPSTKHQEINIASLLPIEAAQFSKNHKSYDLLLGRDIISRGCLFISGAGHFSFSF